ncbi:hypothetical protein BDF20DRAFT_804819, partial [Mycotypha africana]|uniref:uncharacterized protein n=1 Tax=Mycotypha africana TaxID=64632 RepID=UPI0023008FD6
LNLLIKINAHQMLGLTLSQLLDFIVDVANQYHFFQRTSATTTATASESHKILPLYHTFYHAADVMTMLHYFCHDLKANEFLTDMDRVCLMVAALCHDIGHPGLNNHFQVSMKTELAKQFGDKSTLEMYSVYLTINHVATALEREKFIETIRDFILSTDMMYHQELEKQQKAGETAPAVLNEKGRFDLCRILLHAADISNMTRPWSIAKQWSDLVVQEFYLQGDEEKKNQKTVSPGMDRDSNTQASISLKFGSFIHPFFEALAHLLPASYILVDYLSSNRLLWETAAGNTEHMSKKRKISSSGDTCSTHLLPN